MIAVGAGRGLLVPAGLGALAAAPWCSPPEQSPRPLSRVPEKTLKFAVGVMLSAFGVFWTGEGLGIAWPGEDLALPVIAASFLGAGLRAAPLGRKACRGVRLMTMLKELAGELIGMFFAEKRLAVAVLAIVAVAGSLVDFADLNPLVGGAVLLFGCLILLIENVCRAARMGA